jgi:hypothetical protein
MMLSASVWRPLPHNSTPDQQDDYCSDHRADQASAFLGAVPSQGLTQPRSNKRTHNSKDGCQDESRGLVAAWRNDLRDNARDEPDNDGPNYAHGAVPLKSKQVPLRPPKSPPMCLLGLESPRSFRREVRLGRHLEGSVGRLRSAQSPLPPGAALAAYTYRLHQGVRGTVARAALRATSRFVSTGCPAPPGQSPAQAGPACTVCWGPF